MQENSSLLNDINKVFIPCRSVLEMEALTSLFLEQYNYNQIKEVPKTLPSSRKLIEIFRVISISPLEKIITSFIDGIVNKLKPVVMYERAHHGRFRMSNVIAYTKTRVCLFFALHRLKVKLLIIKEVLDNFKENNYNLKKLYGYTNNDHNTFISVLYNEFFEKNISYLKLMLSTKKISERVRKLMNLNDIVTNEDLFHAITFRKYLNNKDRIRFIMREIKALIFVINLMFAKIDVSHPFFIEKETIIDAEEIMVSQDFIPTIINSISNSLSGNNVGQLEDLIKAFEFMMKRALEGINNAIEIASGYQIKLDLESTIYDTNDLFTKKFVS